MNALPFLVPAGVAMSATSDVHAIVGIAGPAEQSGISIRRPAREDARHTEAAAGVSVGGSLLSSGGLRVTVRTDIPTWSDVQ